MRDLRGVVDLGPCDGKLRARASSCRVVLGISRDRHRREVGRPQPLALASHQQVVTPKVLGFGFEGRRIMRIDRAAREVAFGVLGADRLALHVAHPPVAKPIRTVTGSWKAATIAAGCPGRIPHDFRRTAVRNMVRRGVPERVAMQLTGHKTRSIFDRYNIVSAGDLRTAGAQLSGLTGTKQGQSGTYSPGSEGETSRSA